MGYNDCANAFHVLPIYPLTSSICPPVFGWFCVPAVKWNKNMPASEMLFWLIPSNLMNLNTGINDRAFYFTYMDWNKCHQDAVSKVF